MKSWDWSRMKDLSKIFKNTLKYKCLNIFLKAITPSCKTSVFFFYPSSTNMSLVSFGRTFRKLSETSVFYWFHGYEAGKWTWSGQCPLEHRGELPSVHTSIHSPIPPGLSPAQQGLSQAQGGPSQALGGPSQALGGQSQALGGTRQDLGALILALGGQS